MKPSPRSWRCLAFTCLSAIAELQLLSCAASGATSTVVPLKPVTTVSVSAPRSSLLVGESVQLTAIAQKGTEINGTPVTWLSSDPGKGVVSATGLVTAVAAGSVTITAAVGEGVGKLSLIIAVVPVASLRILDAGPLPVRGYRTLDISSRDSVGGILTGRSVMLTSSNPLVASVDASSIVTAISAGTTRITATAEGRSATLDLTVTPGLLPTRGVYAIFDQRTFPNGYYQGQMIRELNLFNSRVGSTNETEVVLQMDAMRLIGVNTITFELRTSSPTLVPTVFPDCNVSPDVGLPWPEPPPASLDNLVRFFDLAQAKGIRVMLRLVNTHMEAKYRAESTTWLSAILTRVKAHPALDLILFEGDQQNVDSRGTGTVDACGGQAEPPLYLGPDMPAAAYVQFAINLGRNLGVPIKKLSAEAAGLGVYNVVKEGNAGGNAQNQHLWHPVSVLKTIFDRLNVPDEDRTYALSIYEQRRCRSAANLPCVDASQHDWADDVLAEVMVRVGARSRARVVAAEMGVDPAVSGWGSEEALEDLVGIMRTRGIDGGVFWRWVTYTNEEEGLLNSQQGNPVRKRGNSGYFPLRDIMSRLYSVP